MQLDDLLKLAQKPRRVLPFKVAGLNGFVRGLTAGDVEESAEIADKLELKNNRRVLLAMAICEEDGTPLCQQPEKHIPVFANLPENVVRLILNKVDEASYVDSGELEELAKNSEGETADSPEGSPVSSESAAST